MEKIAKIKQGGLIRKGYVIVTNILKDGSEGESKSYTVSGKVKIREMDGKTILDFNALAGSSVGVTSRRTVSTKAYYRKQSIVVTSYKIIEE